MKHKTHHRELKTLTGIISISSKGIGYVATTLKEDPEIARQHLNTALHGDMVEIILHPKSHRRQTGEVVKIISRAKNSFAGVLEKEHGMFFLRPDDTKMYTDILIPERNLSGAKIGQKVFAELFSWKDARKAPEGKIIKIFGRPGDNDVEMQAIALEKGFDSKFPRKVEEEARRISAQGGSASGGKKEDYAGRRDFRNTLTFTIDPSDAKDFDDALSFRKIALKETNEEEYEIGIHIADVSHYVKIGSELDHEAKERGTSVYLVDRTIPMLPEILSNDLCSLVPHKDRFTMSAVFIIDKNAKIKEGWYGRTVIHSKKRFTYEEAEKSIKHAQSPLHKELSILNNLAKKLTKERFSRGAISLDQEEVKFVLDNKGVPIKVIKKEQGDSNKLIEEFMLLANKKVAETISKYVKKEGVFVYRVHDLPGKEKMEDLAFFLRSLGYRVSLKDGVIPNHEINNILNSLSGKNEKNTVHRAVIRSMAKAIYSTKNIGHYGLAFEYYTHFTSPIRRYPDILVHRFLSDYVSNKKINKEKLQEKIKEYEIISRIASEQEKRASDAERSSIKYKQVEYMSSRVGSNFTGVISGIKEWGIYVEEKETKCEGLVRIGNLGDDFYIFNEKKLELMGQKHKKRYRLGDVIKIKVKAVDLERKTIDYTLV
ncbi:ribonuclease R [Candidatus Nomurabacteria bacterium RIFCSPLOWO2_01_FULL_39_17]|uniref:Ribonuclease R n=1 Tax=Candidatus Nomurabacteria bacterium RIFCSPLOWO2_01_FULL_39_17 TaxID=1801770 RepID=A0A1F6WVS8_9BACT|nr:MAG: ribonuclease R [Candidatus Nomurabacteria bacterium RIFCSPLOWO2_01_FULL_39_17]